MGIPAAIGVAASGYPPKGDQASAVLTGQISAIGPQPPFAFRGPMNLAIWASINTTLTVTKGSLTATVASGTGLAAGVAVNSSLVPPGTTATVVSGTTLTLAPPPVTLWCKIRLDGQIQTPAAYPTAALLGATVTNPADGATGVTIPSGTTVTVINQASIAPTGGPGSGSSGQPGILQLSAAPTAVPPGAGALPPVEQNVPLQFAVTANAILASGADTAAIFTGGAISWNGTLQLERSFDGGATFVVCNIGTGGTLAQWTGATVTPISITFGEPEKNVLYRFNQTVYSSGVINYRVSQTGGAAESLAIGPLTSG
jgi:hypothetical protein